MQHLFDLPPVFPDGFIYHENFLTEAEEKYWLTVIEKEKVEVFVFHGYEAKRLTVNYGYDYHFTSKELTKGHDIPFVYFPLINKVSAHFSLHENIFEELLIIKYPPGSVINWHRDAPPFDLVIGISFNADCVFRLRPYQKENRTRKSTVSFTVKRGSIYLLSGEARSEWEHSTLPLETVRYSITLRSLRKK